MISILRRSNADSESSNAELRKQMVRKQLVGRGIRDRRVLSAMGEVPREVFVSELNRQMAYADCALPIGYDQTISQPYTVAMMCEALGLTGSERVLEVGTGSGYGAAVLSRLAREVHTVERVPELAQMAAARLARLRYANVSVHIADGSLGLPGEAPFEAIIVTAAAQALPTAYESQLAEGGRVVIPVGPLGHGQQMCRFTLAEGEWTKDALGAFLFVPLIGDGGLPDDSQP